MSDYNTNSKFNYADEAYDLGTDNMNNGSFDYYSGSHNATARAMDMTGFRDIAMNKVVTKSFAFMTVALIITAFASLTTSPATAIAMVSGGSFFVLFIAEIAIVLAGNWAIKKNNAALAAVLYTIYSFLTGMTLSIIYLAYTGASIVSVFFITAGMFATMAIIGLVSKKDLSGLGSICMMGLVGIIIASFVNIFLLRSSMFDLIVSIIGVLIFCGLTVYDVNRMKSMAIGASVESENTLALFCAFQLYLDFINLFLKLLRIMGKKK